MDAVAARPPFPSRVWNLRASTLWWLLFTTVTGFVALSWLIGFYLPFSLFEGANGPCTHLPCSAVHRAEWWAFFADDNMVHRIPVLTTGGALAGLFAFLFGVVLLPIAALGTTFRLIRADRRETVLTVLWLTLIIVAVASCFTTTSRHALLVAAD